MKRLRQNKGAALRVVTYGMPVSPKMTLIADDKQMLYYQRWQDGKGEPIYTQDGHPFRKIYKSQRH
jgi:hypothetical protein